MIELSLTNLFGLQSSQDLENLIIKKSSLPGLFPSANNRAEELLAALVLNAIANFQGKLTTEDNHILTTEDGEPITYDNSESYLLNVNYWRKIITVSNGQQYIEHQLVLFERILYETD